MSEVAEEKNITAEERWRATIESYRRTLARYCFQLTRNRADAEDLTHTALVSFNEYMDRNQWEVEIENVEAYLKTIAQNLHVRERRKREVLISYDDESNAKVLKEAERKAMSVEDSISRIEDALHYKKLMATLPIKYMLSGLGEYERRLLYLSAIDEMSASMIAGEVGRDVYAVRYDLNKLWAKLRYRARKAMEGMGGWSQFE